MGRRSLLAVTAAIVIVGCMNAFADGLAAQTTLFGKNLLKNPGAESGKGTKEGAPVAVPGWQTSKNFTVIEYGGRHDLLLPTSKGPDDRGTKFFCAGDGRSGWAKQQISLAPAAADIDKGSVKFNLSGWLGGYLDQKDATTYKVEFLNAKGKKLKTVSIPKLSVGDRDGETKLILRTAGGVVPAGARKAVITIAGQYELEGYLNDAYADNLSFVLNGPEEEATGSPPQQ